ncbi:hypothetical protein [Stutzerimonas stutzeri]|nr:hypothetical protein [Stutzerimonas stutzeri]
MTSPEYIHTAHTAADVGQATALQRFRVHCPALGHLIAMVER